MRKVLMLRYAAVIVGLILLELILAFFPTGGESGVVTVREILPWYISAIVMLGVVAFAMHWKKVESTGPLTLGTVGTLVIAALQFLKH